MPLYPEIEPYETGMLDVGDGQVIHWETSGNPHGRPALVLHGGPGSGLSASTRRFFDPKIYRVIQFDQRGCGKSTPSASDWQSDLSTNTTWHLVDDIERLREHLGVERFVVYGASWGCTLGLAYAQAHPGCVAAFVAAGVTTTRRSEIDWLYRGMAPLFREQWEKFVAGAPEGERDGDMVAAYRARFADTDATVRFKAAKDFHDWEAASVSADPQASYPSRWHDADYRMMRARIVLHYFHHNAWLDERQLLDNAGRLASIPAVLVQGRLDLQAPLVTAWELARVWPGARLQIIENAGHSAGDGGMGEAIVAALDGFGPPNEGLAP